MAANRIEQGDGEYPMILRDRLEDNAPSCLYAMGEAAILRHRLLGADLFDPVSGKHRNQDARHRPHTTGRGRGYGGDRQLPFADGKGVSQYPSSRQSTHHCMYGQGTRKSAYRQDSKARGEGRSLAGLSPFGEGIRRTTVAQAIQRTILWRRLPTWYGCLTRPPAARHG